MKCVFVQTFLHACLSVSLSAWCFSDFIFQPSSDWLCDPRFRSFHLPLSWTVMIKAQIIKMTLSRCHETYQEQMGGLWFLSFPQWLREWLWGLVWTRDGEGKHIEIRTGWLDAVIEFQKFSFLSVCCTLENVSDISIKSPIKFNSALFCSVTAIIFWHTTSKPFVQLFWHVFLSGKQIKWYWCLLSAKTLTLM